MSAAVADPLAGLTTDEIRTFNANVAKAGATPAGTVPGAVSDTPIAKGRAPGQVNGGFAPDSKRFSLTNWLVNGLYGANPDAAKFETSVMQRYRKAVNESGQRYHSAPSNAFWMPLSHDMMGDAVNETDDAKYCKAVMSQSGGQYDPDEADWLVRKGLVHRKAQSAYFDATGGALVAPPTMGEVIPLMRPNAAFLAAGAQTMALPPSGRYVRPRITSATTATSLGEGQTTTSSTVGTNQMVMQAKKIAGAVYINEEFGNFTSGTGDALVQADLSRTLGLKVDAYAFYGNGTTEIPAGLTSPTYTGAVIDFATDYPAASGIQTNGNVILPQYGDQLPTLIEERSFGMDSNSGAWVMRPACLSNVRSQRASAVTAGDQAGVYVDLLKRFTDAPAGKQFSGRKVVTTTNLKNNLTKGSATDLSDAFYGLWEYGVMGTYGAMQFAQGNDGNTFLNGQYIIRGTMWADIGFIYPQAFLWYTKVLGAAELVSNF